MTGGICYLYKVIETNILYLFDSFVVFIFCFSWLMFHQSAFAAKLEYMIFKEEWKFLSID